jgi:hypothetical protein
MTVKPDHDTKELVFLKPSIRKFLGLLFVGSCMAAAGWWLIFKGKWIGWPTTIFSAILIVVSFVQIIPGSCYLRIQPEGFEVCSQFRRRYYLWKDVTGFRVATAFSHQSVEYGFTQVYLENTWSNWVIALLGEYAVLPDSFGMSCVTLAELMNRCKYTFSPDESRLPLGDSIPGDMP